MESADWPAPLQKIFEAALQATRTLPPNERWDAVAERVPGKSKGECLHRYKAILTALKAKKEASAGGNGSPPSDAAPDQAGPPASLRSPIGRAPGGPRSNRGQAAAAAEGGEDGHVPSSPSVRASGRGGDGGIVEGAGEEGGGRRGKGKGKGKGGDIDSGGGGGGGGGGGSLVATAEGDSAGSGVGSPAKGIRRGGRPAKAGGEALEKGASSEGGAEATPNPKKGVSSEGGAVSLPPETTEAEAAEGGGGGSKGGRTRGGRSGKGSVGAVGIAEADKTAEAEAACHSAVEGESPDGSGRGRRRSGRKASGSGGGGAEGGGGEGGAATVASPREGAEGDPKGGARGPKGGAEGSVVAARVVSGVSQAASEGAPPSKGEGRGSKGSKGEGRSPTKGGGRGTGKGGVGNVAPDTEGAGGDGRGGDGGGGGGGGGGGDTGAVAEADDAGGEGGGEGSGEGSPRKRRERTRRKQGAPGEAAGQEGAEEEGAVVGAGHLRPHRRHLRDVAEDEGATTPPQLLTPAAAETTTAEVPAAAEVSNGGRSERRHAKGKGEGAAPRPAKGEGRGERGKGRGKGDSFSREVSEGAAVAAAAGATEKTTENESETAAAATGGGKGSAPLGKQWWRRLTTTDPITLEPLRMLRQPPFRLPPDLSLTHETESDYYDPRPLATYLISTGRFEHPFSRRELLETECAALDEHLTKHRLGGADVLYAYRHREEYKKAAPLPNVADIRATATALLESLYANSRYGARAASGASSGASSVAAGGMAAGGAARASTGVPQPLLPGALLAPPVMQSASGGLTMVDDDLLPAHATGRNARGEWAAAAGTHAVLTLPSVNPFPSLPQPAPRPAAPVLSGAILPPMSSSLNAVLAAVEPTTARPPAPATTPSAAGGEGSGHRLAAFAAAIGRDPNDPSSFATGTSMGFSVESLAVAKAQPAWVRQVDELLSAFCRGDARRESLPAMTKQQRGVVHEMAKAYNISTQSYDNEPRRHVDLFRTPTTLLSAGRVAESLITQATSGAPHASGPSGAAAGYGFGGGPAEYCIDLVDVQCSQAAMATTLRALSGDYSVRLGPPPPDGSAPKVTLAFEALGAARAALDALGGGMRGSFRVVPPPWATNKKPAHNTALAAGGGSLNTAPGLPPGLASLPPALPPPPQASVPLPPAILEVAALGFTPDQAAFALQSTGGHVAQAIELLIAQGGADSFTPKGGGLPPPKGLPPPGGGLPPPGGGLPPPGGGLPPPGGRLPPPGIGGLPPPGIGGLPPPGIGGAPPPPGTGLPPPARLPPPGIGGGLPPPPGKTAAAEGESSPGPGGAISPAKAGGAAASPRSWDSLRRDDAPDSPPLRQGWRELPNKGGSGGAAEERRRAEPHSGGETRASVEGRSGAGARDGATELDPPVPSPLSSKKREQPAAAESASAAAADGSNTSLDRALGGAPTDHTLVTELQALGYPLLACRTAARVVTSEHKDAGRAAWLEAGKAWLQDKVDKGELKAPMPKTAPVPAPAPPAPTAAEVAKARRMAAHTAAEKLKAEKPSNRPAANAFALLLNEDDNADDDDEDDEEDDEEDDDEDNDKEK